MKSPRLWRALWVLPGALLAGAAWATAGEADATAARPSAVALIADEYLAALAGALPETGTELDLPGTDHGALSDNTEAGIARWRATEDALLARLEAAGLQKDRGESDRILHAVLLDELERSVGVRVCRLELWGVASYVNGWQARLTDLARIQPVGTDADREAALRRARAIPGYIDNEIVLLRQGLQQGYSSPKVIVREVIDQLDALLATSPEQSPFSAPAQRDGTPQFGAAYYAVVRDEINPAIRRYRDFLDGTYLPAARDAIGVSANPDGRACYEAVVRQFSTVPMPADEVYATGLREIRRLDEELRPLALRLTGSDDVAKAMRQVTTDPRYAFRSEGDVIAYAQAAQDRAVAAMPRAFGLYTKVPVEIQPYPEFRARAGAPGQYQAPPEDGSRPPIHLINTWDPTRKSRAGVESTTFHETWPGHHQQVMVARGAQGQHRLVRTLWNSGFGEGWALYAERVADELQLYSGDLDRFGYLASAKFRAARMVLDAGIHTRGMGYEEALAFLGEQSTSSAEEVRGEVNRYISWPGQAPSYMIGNLEILRLREDARARLGERFDIREFHDRVLGHGTLTLPLLRDLLEEWTARTASASGASDDMAALYKTTCAICHEVPETKAPPTETLRRLPAAQILMAMELGKMQPQAAGLQPEQRVRLSKWLAAEEDAKRDAWIAATACPSRAQVSVPVTGRQNWGLGQHNAREALGVTIGREDVGRLELQWAIALPAVNSMRSQPVVAGDTVFLGSKGTHLLALDRHSGCVRWSLAAEAPIHSALTLGQTPDGVATLFFADEMAMVYAVDATTGQLRWRERLKWFPTSIVSGPITYHAGRLYVPVSSFEVAAAGLPTHECCRSHGGIAALDATSGAAVWRFDTTPHATRTTVNRDGVQMWGPSGAVVWNAPTVDVKRGALYFGTGQNSSSPATGTSDAIIALDLDSGAQRWIFQALAGDAWNAACLSGGASCPEENGPDFDFGAAVILLEREAGDLLLAGQKSGEVFALDPDRNGAVVWRRRVGSGSSNGGVHHGMATDGERVYVPVADPERKRPGYVPKPGVYALDVADGRLLWSHPVERGCAFDPADAPLVGLAEMAQGRAGRSPWPACSYYYGHSSAAVVGNGVVYAGALDGKLRMLDARSGELLRVIETSRPWPADNGVEGHGGAIDVGGAIVDGGQVFVLSGYGMFGQMPGNVMLVYGVAATE